MPDSSQESVVNQLVGAAFGACGQRCMALSVAVFVGESQKWIDQVVEKAKGLSIGPGIENKDIGPLISQESKNLIFEVIEKSIK